MIAQRSSPPWHAWILVTIFPEIRATKFLAAVRPAVYVKGGDYTSETLDEEERAILKEIEADDSPHSIRDGVFNFRIN